MRFDLLAKTVERRFIEDAAFIYRIKNLRRKYFSMLHLREVG
jgi:hypothetical protein